MEDFGTFLVSTKSSECANNSWDYAEHKKTDESEVTAFVCEDLHFCITCFLAIGAIDFLAYAKTFRKSVINFVRNRDFRV